MTRLSSIIEELRQKGVSDTEIVSLVEESITRAVASYTLPRAMEKGIVEEENISQTVSLVLDHFKDTKVSALDRPH